MHPGDAEAYGTDLARKDIPEDLEESLSPVNRWRYGVFVDAGFDPIASHRLALSKADVHQVLRALENECSLELALEIFL
jgi:hypothetical protein